MNEGIRMLTSESTCWTVIRAAAAGSSADRDELARCYLGVVRAYLAARWRRSLSLSSPTLVADDVRM